MKILGLIPVRGNSKGIPGKNVKLLGGRPLVQYTLEAARKSARLTRYVVSTDSEEIAHLLRSLGEEVPFLRPAALAEDDTPTLPVIQHAIQHFESKGIHFDAVCILQATNPFRVPGFIDQAIARFEALGCDAMVSVLQVPWKFNPHWTFEPDAKGFLKIATGEETIISRRQDLKKAFVRDGAIYLTCTEVIMNQNSLYGTTLGYIESDSEWYANIDTMEDWMEAERKVEKFKERCAE
jgi:CMP-N,N'-diacetyllegionaminic acid synthase